MDQLHLPNDIPVNDRYARLTQVEEDDDFTSALSMTSTRHNFRRENGRLYLDYRSPHPFPHDDESHQNEGFLHLLVSHVLEDHLIAAPTVPEQLRSVLDVGTGRGLWAEDMADRYPDCQVVAVDLVSRESSVLPNCNFIRFDIVDEWIFDKPNMKFDLVHIRSLFASLAADHWPTLYQECMRHMESGGWIEQTEVEIVAYCDDETRNPDSQVEHLAGLSDEMSEAYGTDFRIADRMEQEMITAGFQDVKKRKFKLPLGHWSADPRYYHIGMLFEGYYKSGLEGWMMHIMTRRMGWSGKQVSQAVQQAFQEIDSREHHYYFHLIIATGRKP